MAAPASAATLVNGYTGQPLGQPFTRWLDESHAPLPTGTITVWLTPGDSPCGPPSAYAGCSVVNTSGDQVTGQEMWLNTSAAGQPGYEAYMRQAFYHELGHQLDLPGELTDAQRVEFARIWRISVDWWQPFGHWQGEALVEWFAEAYRYCSNYGLSPAPTIFHDRIPRYEMYGFRAYENPKRMQQTCAMIGSVAELRRHMIHDHRRPIRRLLDRRVIPK